MDNTIGNPIVAPPMPRVTNNSAALVAILVVGMISGAIMGGFCGYYIAENSMAEQVSSLENAYMASMTEPTTNTPQTAADNPLQGVKTNPFE